MSKVSQPLVSIGIPVLNGEQFLPETLDSLLKQTYTHIEIIICDNASTDNTANVLAAYAKKDSRISVITKVETVPYAENANTVVQAAKGDFIALFHADDVYEPSIIGEQVAYLQQHPNVGGVFTQGDFIDELSQPLNSAKFSVTTINPDHDVVITLDQYVEALCTKGNPLICPTCMFRQGIYQTVGLYQAAAHMVEDVDMYLRVLQAHSLAVLAKPLIHYRIHQSQGSYAYRTYQRREVARDVQYLLQYINQHAQYQQYQIVMQQRLAFDHIKLAIYAAMRGEYQYYQACIHASRESFRFGMQSFAKSVLQAMPTLCSYPIIRLSFRLFARIKKR